MPSYEHLCTNCQHEWEDFYSIKADPPKTCPQCHKETVKRLISGGSGKGIVELEGRDLVKKLWDEGKKMAKDEKIVANVLGKD